MTKRTEKLRDYLSGKVLPYHGLADLGIELQQIDDQLEEEGIEKFVSPYHKLLVTLGTLSG